MIQPGVILNDRYEIIEKIGSGGMSDVYKARCGKLHRYVAIKVLKDEFRVDDNFVAKFKVEAQSAASLSHHNIVNVYDVGFDKNVYYIVMEYVQGITLKDYIKNKGQLSVDETINLSIQIASGIEQAHQNHIIHRDIKPQNIIISKDGSAKVTDFGIARAASSATIAVGGNVAGSVHYISPEQARGGYSDEKSDLYSLGITMYEMVTGTLPFEGDSNISVALLHIQEEIKKPSLTRQDLPSSLDAIIMKCTQKKPERRYQSMTELIVDLKKARKIPDGDFVEINDVNDGKTVFMTEEDVLKIRKSSDIQKNVEHTENDALEKPAKKHSPFIEKLIISLGVLLAIVIVTSVAMFAVGKIRDRLIPKEVKVPLIEGLTVDEATELLTEKNLKIHISKRQYTDEKINVIVKQSPDEDLVVQEESVINVIVSLGIETYPVPKVINMKFEGAEKILDDAGFNVIKEQKYSDIVDLGVVMNQYPEPGTELKKGSDVTIVISKGEQTVETTVPNIKGLTEAQALQKLSEMNIKVGNISYAENRQYEKGIVFYQSTPPGEKVPENKYKLDFTVSKGYRKIINITKTFNNLLDEDQEVAEVIFELEQDGAKTVVFEDMLSKDDFPKTITIQGKEGTGTLTIYIDGEENIAYPITFKEGN